MELHSPGWEGVTVAKAESFADRLLGMRSVAAKDGLILRARSIHTIGMRREIRAVSTSPSGEVLEIRDLRPNRIAFFPGARTIIELPVGTPVPDVGAIVTLDE